MNQTIDDHFESINSDEFLVSALQMLGKAIGFRAEREFESGWVDAVTRHGLESSRPVYPGSDGECGFASATKSVTHRRALRGSCRLRIKPVRN